MPAMEAGIAALVIGIVVIGILAAVMRGNYEKTLRELGEPIGLRYERHSALGVGMGHSLVGWLDGRPFQLIVAPTGANGVLEESWEIKLAGVLPSGFGAGKNGWLRSATAGSHRVQSGDAELDKKVFVEAHDPQQAWGVFASDQRKSALRALAEINGLVFDNKVMFHKSGFDNNTFKLRARLDTLRMVAQAMDPVQPQPPQQQPYPPQQQPYPPR
jgi:hypothetical protein